MIELSRFAEAPAQHSQEVASTEFLLVAQRSPSVCSKTGPLAQVHTLPWDVETMLRRMKDKLPSICS